MMGSSGLRRFALVGLGAILVASCGILVDTSGLSGGADPAADGATPADGATAAEAGNDAAQTGDSSSGVDSSTDAKADAPVATYRDVVLADGPIAYYRLAETAGSVAKDETGNHPGTYAGSVDYNQPGPAASVPSVRFNGSARVTASSVATLPVGTFASYTLEAFVAVEVQGASTFFLNFAAAGGGGGPSLWVDDTTQKFRYSRAGVIDSTKTIGTTWHHFAVTATGSTVSLYVDGAFDVSGAMGTIAPDRGTFTIGNTFNAGVDGGAPSYGTAFQGRLCEVAVYGKVLSAAQIAAHYAARP
jgi:hypothetical protein